MTAKHLEHVFIDSNVFLDFYQYPKSSMDELKKFSLLFKRGDLALYLPQLVVDEVERNRPNKIAAALKNLDQMQVKGSVPNLCEGVAEAEELVELARQLADVRKTTRARVDQMVGSRTLSADVLINEIFETANPAVPTDDLFAKASRRVQLGNPPGKEDSFGDRLIWEQLLEDTSGFDHLYVVTNDGDWASGLKSNEINPFLGREWAAKSTAKLTLFTSLAKYLSAKFPNIDLATELEKDRQIERLQHSGSFATTHTVVGELLRLGTVTGGQARAIERAFRLNPQVRRIAADSDVLTLLVGLEDQHGISDKTLARLPSEAEARIKGMRS